jgi:hypothetical protein
VTDLSRQAALARLCRLYEHVEHLLQLSPVIGDPDSPSGTIDHRRQARIDDALAKLATPEEEWDDLCRAIPDFQSRIQQVAETLGGLLEEGNAQHQLIINIHSLAYEDKLERGVPNARYFYDLPERLVHPGELTRLVLARKLIRELVQEVLDQERPSQDSPEDLATPTEVSSPERDGPPPDFFSATLPERRDQAPATPGKVEAPLTDMWNILVEETAQKLRKGKRRKDGILAKLVRFLAAKEGYKATNEEIVTGFYKRTLTDSRRLQGNLRTARRTAERTRYALDHENCPLRLALIEGVWELRVATNITPNEHINRITIPDATVSTSN